MAKIMDPILPIISILRYRAIILGFFGGPGERKEEGPKATSKVATILNKARCRERPLASTATGGRRPGMVHG